MQPTERLIALRRTQRFITLIEALATHGASSGGSVLIQPAALTMLCQVARASNLFMAADTKWQEHERLAEVEAALIAMADAQREAEADRPSSQ